MPHGHSDCRIPVHVEFRERNNSNVPFRITNEEIRTLVRQHEISAIQVEKKIVYDWDKKFIMMQGLLDVSNLSKNNGRNLVQENQPLSKEAKSFSAFPQSGSNFETLSKAEMVFEDLRFEVLFWIESIANLSIV